MKMLTRDLAVRCFAVAWLALCFNVSVRADVDIAGVVEAEIEGKRVLFTSLKSHYEVSIVGDVANVRLTQTFENPADHPVNARYLFPMNRGAAVHNMVMRVGDEVITAQIQEKRQAVKTFQKAKAEGKAASLLTQHRPNMFTQRIANLMPGDPIKVTIEYDQPVPKIDGSYELQVPMIVGPRFQPASAGQPTADGDQRWQLEQLPPTNPRSGVHIHQPVPPRVSLELDLETPLTLGKVLSPTHAIEVTHRSSTQVSVGFANGKVPDNRDFVLRYRMQAAHADLGVLTHWQPEEGGYFTLLIEPPAAMAAEQLLPREMVFLLDCSGSMGGLPLNASKLFMYKALEGLRPTDTFRIIRFSDSATEFSAHPVQATPENIELGKQYTASLSGGGGTHMSSGILQALGGPRDPARVKNIIFLTDGYIGNELTVLELLETKRQGAKLFAYGVGTGVNRYLMDELGRVGQGFTRYLDPTSTDESATDVAEALAARLAAPVLSDLTIDWDNLPVSDVHPAQLPDLYLGDTLRITGRYSERADGDIRLTGKQLDSSGNLTSAKLVLPVAFSDTAQRSPVRRLWARSAVRAWMQEFVSPPERRAGTHDEIKSAVTDLGLGYRLATRWTAFVAVSRKVVNPEPDKASDSDVLLPKVAGVANTAYPKPAPMTGYAAPEPETWLALLVALGVLGVRLIRHGLKPSGEPA